MFLVLSFITTGCTTYESQIITQDTNGNIKTTSVAGVPIVVTVPQKLGFIATDSTYLLQTPQIVNGEVKGYTQTRTTETTIDKTPISLGASQLIALDIKRPAYGTADTSMELNGEYPTKLTAKLDDKTLDRALTAANDLINKFSEKQGAQIQGDVTRTLISQRQYMIIYDPSTQNISTAPLGR
jgi:hypothetical protein